MKIYLIYANDDMTEGCGPMRLVKVMANKKDAVEFALRQPGVMGITGRQTVCSRPAMIGLDQGGTRIVSGDWDVVEIELESKS